MARNERIFWYSLLASFVAILLIGFVNPAAFSGASGDLTYTIRIRNFGFVPTFAVVSSGTTVVWVNGASEMQLLSVPGAFGPQEIGPGMNWSYKFITPGVYEYRTRSVTGVLVVD